MDPIQVKEAIRSWLAPELESRDFFLVDVRISMGRKIEVYIDNDPGIQIEECAQISRFLEARLDENSKLVPENYILEVSSPGMSNPLKVPRQFKKRIGRRLDITLTDGSRLEAILKSADEQGVELEEYLPPQKPSKKVVERPEAQKWSLPYSAFKKVFLHFEF
jgi:ribosome maturation factor RimP